MHPKCLSAKKAAEMLDMHPNTLKQKARSGEIPGCKKGNKWVFIDVDLLEDIRSQYKPKESTTIEPCHSTSAKIRPITGSRSSKTEEQYAAALGLTTVKRRKNSTIS